MLLGRKVAHNDDESSLEGVLDHPADVVVYTAVRVLFLSLDRSDPQLGRSPSSAERSNRKIRQASPELLVGCPQELTAQHCI